MIQPFYFARMPVVYFGAGQVAKGPDLIGRFGTRVLIVTGGKSYKAGGYFDRFASALDEKKISYFQVSAPGEPTPDLIDLAVAKFKKADIDVVLAWGGGSAVDAGKAISAMLPSGGSVFDFLEGVGDKKHDGSKVPFIAVPTTAGTGSEATKNAVLSRVGDDGFKKSLRHDNFVPDYAILDPELALSCPASITAACGMDAFTQLLESYVSTKASPVTDALAWSGLEKIASGLLPAYIEGETNVDARADMAYAAFLSGFCLANAGLGIVHGLASPLGGFFDIPHGVVCGTLLGEATKMTILKLLSSHGEDHPALKKYARVGALVAGKHPGEIKNDCERLVEKIDKWLLEMGVLKLGVFGIREDDFAKIIDGTGNKNNPIALEPDEIYEILSARL